MDVIEIAERIDEKIRQLERGRAELKKRGDASAKAISDYRKERAKVIMQLRNGVEFELDDVKIKNPSVSITDNLARGICWKEKLAEQLAINQYTTAINGMKALTAELNGLQSIYRHLEEK